MLKPTEKLKRDNFEALVINEFKALLKRIPFIRVKTVQHKALLGGASSDFTVEAGIVGQTWRLHLETTWNGQPRAIREILQRLKILTNNEKHPKVYAIVAAPFLSEDSVKVCQQAGVGHMDLAGNAGLTFDHVFIERQVSENPHRQKREQRSVFTRKSGRILRVMLTPPIRSWTVMELAAATKVSLGQISNVRKMLLDREWAAVEVDGLRLTRPEDIAREWQRSYQQKPIERQALYSLLHGPALEAALSRALAGPGEGKHAVLASFSAAKWIAPFVRQATQFVYADATGKERLVQQLELRPVPEGENFVILRPEEDDVFTGRINPAPDIWCTGLVQTWLDLGAAGERGVEAAEHLLSEKLLPAWRAVTRP